MPSRGKVRDCILTMEQHSASSALGETQLSGSGREIDSKTQNTHHYYIVTGNISKFLDDMSVPVAGLRHMHSSGVEQLTTRGQRIK